MEAKEKGVVLDAKAEAFLADVECIAHYDDSLTITTTTSFKVSHKDAYDSDVDEAPHAAATFMANLTGSDVNLLQSGRIGSGLVTTPTTPSIPPTEKHLSKLFQPSYDEDE
uniref:Uncharacterized protein n=1 Tax=Tanacetum cinerariifolium TaxID=118510 RepID=A0A699QE68_TANCI|nr:hypothetical protein [Tanacetum cinerariifolium]